MKKETVLRNPKLKSNEIGKSRWYDYYAGYSMDFVEDIINYLDLPNNSIIMDPWNGSGTTTQIAEEKGYPVFGFDINPVMVMVAIARRLDSSVYESINGICNEIISKSKKYGASFVLKGDPLLTWFCLDTVVIIRKVERALQEILISKQKYEFININKKYDKISSLAAFFYVGLFRTVKELLKCFKSSNPTWIKTPLKDEDKLTYSKDYMLILFKRHISEMAISIIPNGKNKSATPNVNIKVSSSENIPLDNKSVKAVISSPPYCTRIDYAIATKVELAVLGFSMEKNLTDLRKSMIGTPTINNMSLNNLNEWGTNAIDLLHKVKHHSSKSSNSYYYKNYLQYFNSMYLSLIEINRTLCHDGYTVMVIQDSYYKDVHVDLSQIITEMTSHLSWSIIEKFEFYKKQTLGGINTHSGKYRSSASAVESVLIFKKSGGN